MGKCVEKESVRQCTYRKSKSNFFLFFNFSLSLSQEIENKLGEQWLQIGDFQFVTAAWPLTTKENK